MKQVILALLVGIATFVGGIRVDAVMASSSQSVVLDETVYMTAPDTGDMAIPAGRYQIEEADSRLVLVGAGGHVRLMVEATPVRHQQEIEASQAVAFRLVPDQFQIVLLLPGGRGYAAQGTTGEVRSRGTGLLKSNLAGAVGDTKGFILPSERELLQEALTKLDALAKQVGPVAQIAQQVNDLQNGKMGFLIQETNRNAYRVCEIVGAHMWGGPAIGCQFGRR